ncbi:MAG: hypothetical protein HYU67_04540 [Flavobacteriia bacterium]|nr:hypothetical protein [Flavobacteriia bacterium]
MKLKDCYEKYQDLYRKKYVFDPDEKTFFTSNLSTFVLPTDFTHWEVKEIKLKQYAEKRFKELNITPGLNIISDKPIFNITDRGDIEIAQFSLKKEFYFQKEKLCHQKRLNPIDEKICEGKYDFTFAKNVPFFSPLLLDLYSEKKQIETLCITEGQFKAWKACDKNIPTVGLTSISHYKENSSGKIHYEIIELIRSCNVKKIVILWDGDCKNISSKSLEQGKDLSLRPRLFYKSALTIRDLIFEYISSKKISVYFATIKTDELEGKPKGFDDLLITHSGKAKEIKRSFEQIGEMPSQYFDWINISTDIGAKKLRQYFNLHNVNEFYHFHSAGIKEKNFVYFGSTYKIAKGMPVIEVPLAVKSYKRIGVNYYKIINCPVPFGKKGDTRLEEVLEPWSKEEIKLDHGKEIIHQIEKYEGFTNVASHTDYQPIINNHWNLYYNVKHDLKEGDYPHIKMLLEHLFEEQYEMILDYISILYRFPIQKLPVICLVSKQQNTGKSTFIFLMKLIFKQNMTIISNNDLTNDFNSHWTSKLIVASEETLLEKKDGYEKIKSLSTAKDALRHEKSKTPKSIPNMLHFIFCSNHEDDFIKIDDYDSRLWIRKIKTLSNRINKFDEKLENEIPFFVHFIANREIQYPDTGNRLYFHEKDFKTSAFFNVVRHSEPNVIKEIRLKLEDYFTIFPLNEKLHLTTQNLRQYFGIKGEDNYINKVIKSYLNVNRYENDKGEPAVTTYSFNQIDYNNLEFPLLIKDKGRPFVFYKNDFIKK